MKDLMFTVGDSGQLSPASPSAMDFMKDRQPGARVVLCQKQNKRSLDQNALINALYAQLGRELGWTPRDVRHYCKLTHGVPILLRDDPDYQSWHSKFIATAGYEDQLKAMEFIPVTRMMTKKQATEYTDAVIMDFTDQGVVIVMPGDQYGG